MENGKVVAISISDSKGEKKHNINEAKLVEGLGIENDAHAEGGERQVSLLADESITRVKRDGLKVSYGDFAENIVTKGVDHSRIRLGDTILIGDETVLKVTIIGKECHSPCNIFRQVGYCIMPEEGVFCSVEQSGMIRVGDRVSISKPDPSEKPGSPF
jgi:MOSC domain-containing protein YiiM